MHVDLPEGKLYYSIGEVAKAFDVNTSLIRFWDKEFDILKPKKNAKGNRKFTPEDIKNLKLIYHLVKERGFTLDGAKTHLKENQKKTLDKFEIISKLESIKNELIKFKAELTPPCAWLNCSSCSGVIFVGSIVTEVAFERAEITASRVDFSKSAAPFTVFTKFPIKSFLLW